MKEKLRVKTDQNMLDNKSKSSEEERLLTVKVIIEDESNKSIDEIIEDIDVTECVDEMTGYMNLKKLVLIIKHDYNFNLENKEIYYYLERGDLYVNCGIDPVNQDMKVRPEDYQNVDCFIIKGKELGVSLVHRLMSFQNISNNSDEKERNFADEMAERSKCRRTKERRIGHIIDKVIEWRKFYSGLINQKNQQIKYSLEDAARQVKISKKSLDDYLFQIRFGHRYGFNFNQHYNDKVGVLRDFVRQRKKNDKVENKSRKVTNKNNEKEDQQ